MLSLNFGFVFEDLNSLPGLQRLDEEFLQYLQAQNPIIFTKLCSFRKLKSATIPPKEYSQFLVELAPILDDFIAELFDIADENLSLKKQHEKFDAIYECRRKFIQRYALKQYTKERLAELDFDEISLTLQDLLGIMNEQSIAKSVLKWQEEPKKYTAQLELIAKYCAFMVHKGSTLMLFDVPMPIDESNHIRALRVKQLEKDIYLGFDYRDKEQAVDKAASHAKYCIYCHKQEKDTCSHGISPEKNGCPLDQKISEMNLLKSQGFNIAALGIIVIDNPLVAATGHRICNDCMKACIYQKQDPVNIPLIESNILSQVLSLAWGVEVYSLLTKWNPLNIDSPLPKDCSGYNVLVTGLGPAGFALSHYLLNEGHNVCGIDGLKISKLHFDAKLPVKFWHKLKIPLSQRMPQGFGGVAEYGITNRWDKNNLNLVRLVLERRQQFQIYGGVRLGSNITTKQAFDLGFDHIALCLGAGKPQFIGTSDYFAKGVRAAADFLMSLQQGGAYLADSNSNLLVRMPSVVIGCGLTAIDSAVELLHYYQVQVERFLVDWERSGSPKDLTDEDQEIANELILHAKLLRKAKSDAEKLRILNEIGGVTVCYRKTIKESPAYRLNHEEIEHAIAMGVKFKENIATKAIHTDKYGYAESIEFTGGEQIKAKSILLAIGTKENEFQDIDELDEQQSDIFKRQDGKISYFGDCNQKYAGSVVKALASAKNGYKSISTVLGKGSPKKLIQSDGKLKSYIQKINILSDDIVEIIIHSPLCAANFRAGQFFKLQNYSTIPNELIEPLALTGAYVDSAAGLISLIILEVGQSSRLCRTFKEGQEVSLMGPIGMPTDIVHNKKVVLVGGGLGNAVLLAVGNALKKNNCHITYIAGYRTAKDRFYSEKIEEFADQVIWSCDQQLLETNREHDFSIKGTIIDGIEYAKVKGLINQIDQVICIGSNGMMQAVSEKKFELFGNAKMICSINSPMQCMMKGICGQCIQKIDDQRGYIFSCACQDQDSDIIDFQVLQNRLQQNSLLEKSRNGVRHRTHC